MVYWLDGRDLPLKEILPRRPQYYVSVSRDEELRDVVRAVRTQANNLRNAISHNDYLQWLTSAREYIEWVVWVSRRYALWGYEDRVKGFSTCVEVFSWLDNIQSNWSARISKETFDIARQRYTASLPIGTVSPPSMRTKSLPKATEREREREHEHDGEPVPDTPAALPSSSSSPQKPMETPKKPSKASHRRSSSTPCADAPKSSPERIKIPVKNASIHAVPRRRSTSTHPGEKSSTSRPLSLSPLEEAETSKKEKSHKRRSKDLPPPPPQPTTDLSPTSPSAPSDKKKRLERASSSKSPQEISAARKSRTVLRMPGYRVVTGDGGDDEILVLRM
ncbi:uncharacterized protein EI90DRAFT_3153004 [Cantharellus anzutake]|uniref:uncharacterized protein n=1 Tax=Cantharellus anzutake TaxID=1750568 RepID=UPI001906536F|nr:uncharacterized protein EI90DRAFT_3153004 [Cantharellus anzutake]KAF8335392.1 hypothetical protein EI90DRAFT_3153004 [Cantharellus anzutake]